MAAVTSPPRVVLGFDYGTRRIGVAIGQRITGTARPLTTLYTAHQQQPDWRLIEKLIQEWRPQLLLVGRPLQLDDTEQPMTAAAVRFGNRLHGRFRLPVAWVDERLSSYVAEFELAESPRRPDHRISVDSLAAAKIVETWLSQQPPLASL